MRMGHLEEPRMLLFRDAGRAVRCPLGFRDPVLGIGLDALGIENVYKSPVNRVRCTITGWSPLCGLDASGQPIQAVAVAGVWRAAAGDSASYASSTTQFTLACRGKTIAKCIELGYKTHKGYTNQMASCVRLLRGDYCGTGSGYTVDGTIVNLYDNFGVQVDTQAWAPEAEWTPTGARCVNANNNARYELARSKDPKCVKPLKTTTCGTTFSNGAILIDELNPNFQQ
jgi:hypothetical protein